MTLKKDKNLKNKLRKKVKENLPETIDKKELQRILKPFNDEIELTLKQFTNYFDASNFEKHEIVQASKLLNELKATLFKNVERWTINEVNGPKRPSKIRPFQTPNRESKLHKALAPACEICEETRVFHIAHIIPRHLGGSNDLGNLLRLCGNCHALFDRKHIDVTKLNRIDWSAKNTDSKHYVVKIYGAKI